MPHPSREHVYLGGVDGAARPLRGKDVAALAFQELRKRRKRRIVMEREGARSRVARPLSVRGGARAREAAVTLTRGGLAFSSNPVYPAPVK